MVLFNLIEEQIAIAFTGRINVLNRENHQFLGAVFLDDGSIVGACYTTSKGKKSLFQILFESKNEEDRFSFVVEPEIIDSDLMEFRLEYKTFISEWIEFEKKYEASKKFIPPKGLKLMVKESFIKEGAKISAKEFEVLSLITAYSSVDEIYNSCSLYEYEITEALVSLRKKEALFVVKGELPSTPD